MDSPLTAYSSQQAITLGQLSRRVSGLLNSTAVSDVWVIAELSDLRRSGGHCYMELLEKMESTGATTARMRGIIWANNADRICRKFAVATGRQLATGLRVMVRGGVNYHASYGISFVITDIEPSFTVGEVERRRREILARLTAEGILELNRQLPWPEPALRVAVISARNAAGYGDFIHQLYNSPSRVRFTVKLFTAALQGENTSASVISALDAIAMESDRWDCVVIIRGGGATSDLVSFDDYELTANVAQFPLPVIVGIGHERDITVLDYVAWRRVKTPTAAAELLISAAEELLGALAQIAEQIHSTLTRRLSGCLTQLAYIEGQLPSAPGMALQRASARLDRCAVGIRSIGPGRIAPQLARLSHMPGTIAVAVRNLIANQRRRLDSAEGLLTALSPEATLRRGYSITRVNGRAVTDASAVAPGAVLTTTLASGSLESTVTESKQTDR